MASIAVSLLDALAMLSFLGTIVSGQHLRRRLRDQSIQPWTHALFLGFALAAMLLAFQWFRGPMHDIALVWGSHGRWGCATVNDDGSPAFLLRDDTVPLILFLPVLAMTIAHWLVSRRRR